MSVISTPWIDDAILSWKLRKLPWLYFILSRAINPAIAKLLSDIAQCRGLGKPPTRKATIPISSDLVLPPKDAALTIEGGSPCPESKYLAVISTWDPQAVVDEYVLRTVHQLVLANYRVVLVSTSGGMFKSDIERVRPLCDAVILRQNVGYDFASYKAGISYFHDRELLNSAEGLLIMNDSIVGPFQSFADVVVQLKTMTSGLVGLNDSYCHAHHLQSFFLYFTKEILVSSFFWEFWGNVKAALDKVDIIREYELGLSQLVQKRGFLLRPLYPTMDVVSSAKTMLSELYNPYIVNHLMMFERTNPSARFWSILVDKFRYPFVKRAALLDDSVRLGPRRSPLVFLEGRDEIVPVIKAYIDRVRPFF